MRDTFFLRPQDDVRSEDARVIDAACAVVTGSLLSLAALGWGGLVRVLLAFAFAVYVPGWALIACFAPRLRSSLTAVAVLISVSLLTAVASVALWLHLWYPLQLFDIEAVASIALIGVGATRRERRASHDKGHLHNVVLDDVTELVARGTGRALEHRHRLTISDALWPISIALWIVGLYHIHASPMPLSILPAGSVVVFLAGLLVLVVSAGLHLARRSFSSRRMALHLGTLIVMLYGTAPIVYPEPRFSWLFKHTAITDYIAVNHVLSPYLEIYRVWPGFFALAAWIDKVAGVSSPLVYASWAELFFEIIYAVELAWVLRALQLDKRERWLALFLFAAANWIAQDYFSPQGFGLALSLGVFGIALHWLKGEQRPWVTRLEARARTLIVSAGAVSKLPALLRRRQSGVVAADDEEIAVSEAVEPPRWAAICALLATYAVLTFVHELSPYVVALQLGALVVLGLIRPWWLVAAMFAIALGFLAPNFSYVNNTYGLTASIGNFFGNVQGPSSLFTRLGPEALLSARAARILSLGMWGLAMVGVLRRLHQGRRALGLAALAFSPMVLVVLLAYGNEGVLRIYLFSLPWTACLAASAISPAPKGSWRSMALLRTAALGMVVLLFLVAFFGNDAFNVMTPADVNASVFVYTQARPGPVMTLAENFPAPIGAASYKFGSLEPLLGGYTEITKLSTEDIPFVTSEIVSFGGGVKQPGYFVVSPSMFAYAEEYGLATAAQCRAFVAAMDRAPGWRILYSRGGATIYELAVGP